LGLQGDCKFYIQGEIAVSSKTELSFATIFTLFQSLYYITVLPTQFLHCCT